MKAKTQQINCPPHIRYLCTKVMTLLLNREGFHIILTLDFNFNNLSISSLGILDFFLLTFHKATTINNELHF